MIAIAIDGPSSSGKGTVARGVARTLDYAYVDTGAMYRAVALIARRRGVGWEDAEALASLAARMSFAFRWDGASLRLQVDGEDVTMAIRTGEMGTGASRVSAHGPVRSALLARQRELAAGGGVVMDGRDIGTVVLPDAQLKVFLDASPEERTRRRHAELASRGGAPSLDEVRRALAERDRRDTERAVAPLRRASDAVYIDTTDLGVPDAIERVVAEAVRRGAATPR